MDARHVIIGGVAMSLWLGCQPVPKTEGTAGMQDQASSGQVIYIRHCAICHGPNGKGDASAGLQPPPADLTSAKVQTQLAPQLIKSVHEGRQNTDMGAWKEVLSEQQMEDVVAYLRRLRE